VRPLDKGLIEKTVRYGGEFKKPVKAVMRRHKATSGEKMLEDDQLRRLLDALGDKETETGRWEEKTSSPETAVLKPNPALRAMILLGLNAGFGNHDCATLPLASLDLGRGWLDYPRPKTGIARRCPLWPETVTAIRAALAKRPEPKSVEHAPLAFLTRRGTPWIHFTAEGHHIDNIAIQFGLLLKKLGLHRAGLGFYTLRHVFRTVADAARDPVAIDLIMGHTDPSMAGHYRERIDDGRLLVVAEHVRRWLFGEAPDDGQTDPDSTIPETANSREPGDPSPPNGSDARPTLRLFAG
jgi:integrase